MIPRVVPTYERREILQEVRSADRVSGNAADFRFLLNQPVRDAFSVEIVSSSMPPMNYNVRNCTIRYTDATPTNVSLTLEDGNYTAGTFISALNALWTGRVSFYLNPATNKITTQGVLPSSVLYWSEAAAVSMRKICGFNVDSVIQISTAPETFDLTTDLNNYITIDEISDRPARAGNNEYSFIIPIAAPSPSSTLIFHRQIYRQILHTQKLGTINSLNVKVYGSDGAICSRPYDWSFTLKFTY